MYANAPQRPRSVRYSTRPEGKIPSMDFDFWTNPLPPTPPAFPEAIFTSIDSFESQRELLQTRSEDPSLLSKARGEEVIAAAADQFDIRNAALTPSSTELTPLPCASWRKHHEIQPIRLTNADLQPPAELTVPQLAALTQLTPAFDVPSKPLESNTTTYPQLSSLAPEPNAPFLLKQTALPLVNPQALSVRSSAKEDTPVEVSLPVEIQRTMSLPESGISLQPPRSTLSPKCVDYEQLVGKRIAVDVESEETIGGLKGLIYAKTGLSIHMQQLYYEDKELDNARTLASYGIQPEATLYVHLPASRSQQTLAPEHRETQSLPPTAQTLMSNIQISVKLSTGQVIALSVAPRCTIESLKQQIEDQSGLPKAQQMLLFANKPLIDYYPLAYYGVSNSSLLHLRVKAAGGMTLFIGFCFNSLNSLSLLQLTKLSPSDTSFLIVKPGISFFSKCKSATCIAFNQPILVPKGFGVFDIARVSSQLTCPVCEKRAEMATNCGFYQAKWVFKGQLVSEVSAEREGRTETNHFYTYEGEEEAQWRYLEVTVLRL